MEALARLCEVIDPAASAHASPEEVLVVSAGVAGCPVPTGTLYKPASSAFT